MLLPVVITMGVLVFYPLARGIAFSFTNADRYTIGGQDIPSTYQYIGLENYKTLDDDPNFWNVFKFTGVWTFANVFFHFTIGLGLALMLNRSLRFRGAYRMLLLVPWAVPVFITALRLALPLQRPERVLRPAPARDRYRRPRMARRPDLGKGVRDRRQRLARRSRS